LHTAACVSSPNESLYNVDDFSEIIYERLDAADFSEGGFRCRKLISEKSATNAFGVAKFIEGGFGRRKLISEKSATNPFLAAKQPIQIGGRTLKDLGCRREMKR
jgi:hypothetical protein